MEDDWDTKITRNKFTEYFDSHGMYHRLNGPALVTPFGGTMWYIHGNRHRLDGPAVIWPNGTVEYWINGSQYNIEEFKFLAFCNGVTL